MHARERKARRRENGRDSREQFEGGHDAVLGAPGAGILHAVRKAPIEKATKAIERHRGARPVAEETLAAGVVARRNVHPGMKVEPFVLSGEAEAGRLVVRGPASDVVVGGELREGSSLHRDGGACVERALLGRLVGARFVGRVIDVAVAAEPRHCALVNAPHDLLKLGSLRGRRRVKPNAALLVPSEDAIEKDDVEMQIQVEAAAESLQKCDGSNLGALEFGSGAIASGHGIDEDLHERAKDVLLERGQSA
jgi:hypothetical protein